MDGNMTQLQRTMMEVEVEAEQFLLARHQLVENDRLRNGNRDAQRALRKRAGTTRTSVTSPYGSIMKDVSGPGSKPLVKEVCEICGNHDSKEKTWMMFPGTDIFVKMPFHAAHTILKKDQSCLDYEAEKLHSYTKEKALIISEKGALADKFGPGVLKSLVTLTDKTKWMGSFVGTTAGEQ